MDLAIVSEATAGLGKETPLDAALSSNHHVDGPAENKYSRAIAVWRGMSEDSTMLAVLRIYRSRSYKPSTQAGCCCV